MSTFRYSRWDGSQQLPAFDADDVLDALRRHPGRGRRRRGASAADAARPARHPRRRHPGARRSWSGSAAQRQAELERANLDGVLDDVDRRLEEILETERQGIAERVKAAEQRALDAPPGADQDAPAWPSRSRGERAPARERLTRCRRTSPAVSTACATSEFMDDVAREALQRADDQLRQQMLQTYFQGLKEESSVSRRRTWPGSARWYAT